MANKKPVTKTEELENTVEETKVEEEPVTVVEKKSLFTKIKENKVVRTGAKVISLVGLAAGGYLIGRYHESHLMDDVEMYDLDDVDDSSDVDAELQELIRMEQENA